MEIIVKPTDTLIYDQDAQKYYLNGFGLPRVSDIINFLFPNEYDNVDPKILEDKAQYGEDVHKVIELYNTNHPNFVFNDVNIENSLKEFVKIKESEKLDFIESEKMVHHLNDYAGRLDAIATKNGKRVLIDYKTVSKLNQAKVIWQLSLYNYALETFCDYGAIIWLPKGENAEYIEIAFKSSEDIQRALKAFKNKDTKERDELINREVILFEQKQLSLIQDFIQNKRQEKVIVENNKKLETSLKKAFQNSGLIQYKNDDITIYEIKKSVEKQNIPDSVLKKYTKIMLTEEVDMVSLKKDHPEYFTSEVVKTVGIKVK